MEKDNMKNIWLSKQNDVIASKDFTPLDWADFNSYSIENDEFIIRSANNTREELEKVAETYKSGFPALRGCEFEELHKPEGFAYFLGEGDNFNKGVNYMLVIEHKKSGEITAALIITMLKKLRRGEQLVIAVHEKYQGRGLGRQILVASDKLFEDSGVEMVFGWCAAFHPATQKILLDLGYTPRAVIPGLYRVWAGNDEYQRTVEVFFQKFFNGAEKMCTSDLTLIPEVKESLVVPW